MKTKKHSSLDS